MLTIGTNYREISETISLSERFEEIFFATGVHPNQPSDDLKFNSDDLLSICAHKKMIGVGETGLDFFYNNSDKKKQIQSFEKHIQASIDLKIPLIVHSRDAENDTFELLNNFKNKDLKILMHCFTGSKKFAEKLLNLNTFFSASGIITFKNAIDLQETFKSLPLENLLIETDSPFLAPVPKRGKKNEPSFIDFTAAKLAEIKNLSKEDLVKITTENFNKLFFN